MCLDPRIGKPMAPVNKTEFFDCRVQAQESKANYKADVKAKIKGQDSQDLYEDHVWSEGCQ